jgi:hypothetical protein
MSNASIRIVASAAMILLAGTALAQTTTVFDRQRTKAGLLTIVSVDEGPAEVRLNGRTIGVEGGAADGYAAKAIPYDNPELILLRFSSGGNACSTTYKILDLSGAEPRLVDIGACADNPVIEAEPGRITMHYAADQYNPEETWVYAHGQLIEPPQ